MNKIITDILNAAVSAPSGDNCQPWRFVVRDNVIFLYDIPELDTSLYNWNSISSLLAHGALLENIKISATNFGYSAFIDTAPFGEEKHLEELCGGLSI